MFINYKSVQLELNFYVQPEEMQSLHHKGCAEEIIIEEILIQGIDVTHLLQEQIEEITECLTKNYRN